MSVLSKLLQQLPPSATNATLAVIAQSHRNMYVLLGASVGAACWYATWKKMQRVQAPDKPDLIAKIGEKSGGTAEKKTAVDMRFFRQIWNILKVLVPKTFSAETFYLLLVAVSLIARTYADVWMIANGTAIESAIISRDNDLFKTYLYRFIYAMPAIALVNNLLKLGLNEIKLRFRTNLTNHLYKKYLSGFTYYKMANIDNRISNPDQLLTQDVEKFCDCIADLYSNLSKPILDIVLYSVKLTGSIGAHAPGLMMLYLVAVGTVLTRLRRPAARMTVVEQQLEGEYRYVNSRLITNSEEIAFYQGNKKEQNTISETFKSLVRHLRKFILFRFTMGYVDNIVAKYVATVVGYTVVSRPFFNMAYARFIDSTHSERVEDYYKSGRWLLRLAEALGRVALAGRELTRLAGFTSRVTKLDNVLDELAAGKYQRTMVSADAVQVVAAPEEGEDGQEVAEKVAIPAVKVPKLDLVPGSGNLCIQDHVIRFEDVPLVTPNGDVLIQSLNFEVRSGMNVLICGPNGCGKSSLFRVLGELWPLFGGRLTKPEAGKLFYVPQRPYMTLGTLRDQVTYPDSVEDQKRKGITDEQLEMYLEQIQLSYVLEREGGWSVVQDWMDKLSGGEKQRIAMARIFYHRPQFAILDECTSAVSVDVEGYIYSHCRKAGITLFTVSHRKSLWKHHEYYLHMDGRGAYEFKQISEDTTEFGS